MSPAELNARTASIDRLQLLPLLLAPPLLTVWWCTADRDLRRWRTTREGGHGKSVSRHVRCCQELGSGCQGSPPMVESGRAAQHWVEMAGGAVGGARGRGPADPADQGRGRPDLVAREAREGGGRRGGSGPDGAVAGGLAWTAVT